MKIKNQMRRSNQICEQPQLMYVMEYLIYHLRCSVHSSNDEPKLLCNTEPIAYPGNILSWA